MNPPSRKPATDRTSRLWLALWIGLALLLLVRTGVRDRGVITDHLEFGRRLCAGQDLYAPYLDGARPLHPVYPPSFGLLTAPLTLLSERAARIAWGLLQVLSLWLIGASLIDWLRRARPELVPRAHLVLFLTALLAGRYVLRDAHGGGGNLINLALALGALRLADSGRAGAAALVLGFSLATKPTTLLLVPLLWLCGHRRAAAGALLAALAFVATALAVNGNGVAPLAQWARGSLAYGAMQDVFAEPAQGFPPFTWMNQCLRCAVARYLGTVPESFAAEVPWFFQGAGLPAAATALIARALALALLITTFAVISGRRATGDDRQRAVAATLALSVLLSPISWKAHHTALIPALFLLVETALAGPSVGARRTARIGGALYLLLCSLGGGDLVGTDVKNLEQSLYLATAGTLFLWAFCLFCRPLPSLAGSIEASSGSPAQVGSEASGRNAPAG